MTTNLYRPVGVAELALIRESGFKAFPPRVAHQPVFYPVLNYEYAEQIARDWNTRDEASGFVGFVVRFEVETEFLDRYEVHQAGDRRHQEYWIPAGELIEFNSHIVGKIVQVSKFPA